MSTVNSTSNSYNMYTQNNAQVSSSQGTTKVHHHHNKIESKEPSQFSQEGLQALSNSSNTESKSPLENLVANGTITQDQENSIKSAFQASRQGNISGTYCSKQTNPINSLVSTGIITQDQANAIKSSFQTISQASQGTQQVSGSQKQTGVHHHHHHTQQVQGTTESSQAASQATDSLTESSISSS
jgi:competence protein ComGC